MLGGTQEGSVMLRRRRAGSAAFARGTMLWVDQGTWACDCTLDVSRMLEGIWTVRAQALAGTRTGSFGKVGVRMQVVLQMLLGTRKRILEETLRAWPGVGT